MERAPKENRFEFVVLASKRARQLLGGAVPRETGEKKITIAQKEVLRRKVVRRSKTDVVRGALIALGVTGGIGAYKAVEVCRGLQKRGHDVVAVMTRSATRFVGPAHVRGDHAAAGDHVAVEAGRERRHRAHRHRRRRSPCCSSRRARPTSSASSPTASPTTSSRRSTWRRRRRC